MKYYIAICIRDDHRIFAKNFWGIDLLIEKYIREHPMYTKDDFIKYPIPRPVYLDWLRNRHNPLWWILRHGDPEKEMTSGRKEQIARMAKEYSPLPRNIPHSPTR
jgi:hypothetical protein